MIDVVYQTKKEYFRSSGFIIDPFTGNYMYRKTLVKLNRYLKKEENFAFFSIVICVSVKRKIKNKNYPAFSYLCKLQDS
jgi:hypothetical protein